MNEGDLIIFFLSLNFLGGRIQRKQFGEMIFFFWAVKIFLLGGFQYFVVVGGYNFCFSPNFFFLEEVQNICLVRGSIFFFFISWLAGREVTTFQMRNDQRQCFVTTRSGESRCTIHQTSPIPKE